MSQTIEPNKGIILAKPVKQDKTASGIFVPQQSLEEIERATVIGVGKDVATYKAGDVIVYKEYSVSDTKLNDEDYIMLDQADVLGKVVEG